MQHYDLQQGVALLPIQKRARVETLQKTQKFRSCPTPYVQSPTAPHLVGHTQSGEEGVQVAGTLLVSYQETSHTLGPGARGSALRSSRKPTHSNGY